MVIDFSMQLGKVICIGDPAEAATRDAMMTAAVDSGQMVAAPPLGMGPGLLLDGDPRAGQLFVQGRVARGDAIGRFDDVVGGGFTLISPSGDPGRYLDADAATFFASLAGVTAHVGGGASRCDVAVRVGEDAPVRDVDGTYARWFAEHDVDLVLQRPDFYVFGTAARVEGASTLVRRLRDALHAGE